MAKPIRVNRIRLGALMVAVGVMQIWFDNLILGGGCIAVAAVLICQHFWLQKKFPEA